MIAGTPLPPDGLAALAALVDRHGAPAPMATPLEAALRAARGPGDPVARLATVCARRRLAGPPAEPRGPAPAARFLRRWARRWRVAQRRDRVTPACLSTEDLVARLRAEPDAGARRDLLAAAPLAVATAAGAALASEMDPWPRR